MHKRKIRFRASIKSRERREYEHSEREVKLGVETRDLPVSQLCAACPVSKQWRMVDGWVVAWQAWDVWAGAASAGVCRSARRRDERPGPTSIEALATPARADQPTTNPDARFHYIRHDRCYLHPVMFFDSLPRLPKRHCHFSQIKCTFLTHRSLPQHM